LKIVEGIAVCHDSRGNTSHITVARILLLLAHYDGPGASETTVPKISHETLAEMVGTTAEAIGRRKLEVSDELAFGNEDQ
jgi:hypothetical protein